MADGDNNLVIGRIGHTLTMYFCDSYPVMSCQVMPPPFDGGAKAVHCRPERLVDAGALLMTIGRAYRVAVDEMPAL